MARIVLATLGSLGDLHPVIALAVELRERGHTPEIATSESYRERVTALGFGFHALHPDLLSQGEHIIVDIMDGPRGTERLMREQMFPAVRTMYADLERIVAGADLLVSSELIFAAPIVAAMRPIRWASYQLAPISLFSLHDPPILATPEIIRWIQRGGLLHRVVKRLAKLISNFWAKPVRDLRRELGLPRGKNPLFDGKFSPQLNLAMFSAVLQAPQPDWPANTVQTGTLFYDETASSAALPEPVARFLAAGEPPIVFTLGSAAVYIPGEFYAESAKAAQLLGRRALLLIGKNAPPANLPDSVLAWDYLPFAQIFPHAAAIVHQGGVGTTAQALRAGKPMAVVPFAHDQFDNAGRVARLGVGCEIHRRKYTAATAARALAALLENPRTAAAAAAVAERVRAERGAKSAADAIERVLA
jgi:rhamnosyltransferase subunit B